MNAKTKFIYFDIASSSEYVGFELDMLVALAGVEG